MEDKRWKINRMACALARHACTGVPNPLRDDHSTWDGIFPNDWFGSKILKKLCRDSGV